MPLPFARWVSSAPVTRRSTPPPSACLAALADPTTWPDWARDLEKVKVRGTGPDGVADQVEVTVGLLGVTHKVLLALTFDTETHELVAELLESPKLKALRAVVRFEPAGRGSRFDYRLTAELSASLRDRIERMAARKVETALTRDLVRWIERGDRRR